jgi:hypothetical protein
MTDHPCKGMTKAQIAAFEQIAINVALPPVPKGTLAALEKHGLIERAPDKKLHDEMGDYSLPQYFVPLPIHMQWCQWASERPEYGE